MAQKLTNHQAATSDSISIEIFSLAGSVLRTVTISAEPSKARGCYPRDPFATLASERETPTRSSGKMGGGPRDVRRRIPESRRSLIIKWKELPRDSSTLLDRSMRDIHWLLYTLPSSRISEGKRAGHDADDRRRDEFFFR